MYLSPRSIIKHYFNQEFPNGNVEKLDKVLSKYREDELERFADMVYRFGIAAILDVVEECWRN